MSYFTPLESLSRPIQISYRTLFQILVDKLVKNSAQQKQFHISDCTETSTCDDYISKNKIAINVILAAYEWYRSVVIPRRISYTLQEPKSCYDQNTTDCSRFLTAQMHHLVIFITPNI